MKYTQTSTVDRANVWREQYNPLRGISIARAVSWLEDLNRGITADAQWYFRAIEAADATHMALVERRQAAIGKLDWKIKVSDRARKDQRSLAEEQVAVLNATYERIRNLKEAIKFLQMAKFRGYAHLQMRRNFSNDVVLLQVFNQWNMAREGMNGQWLYNPQAASTHYGCEPIDSSNWLIREVAAPIDRIGAITYLRKTMSQKDWDGFIETFGIPPIFIELPAGSTPAQQAEFQTMCENIISDMRGTLPSGAKAQLVDASDAMGPFEQHLKYQDSQLVLCGTGGKATMLETSTGLGSGVSTAQADVFDDIAQAEAGDIDEVMAKLSEQVLNAEFPGLPHLAYFSLAAKDKKDVKAIITDAVAGATVGFRMKVEQLNELTGYQFVDTGMPGQMTGLNGEVGKVKSEIAGGSEVTNSEKKNDSAPSASPREEELYLAAKAKDLKPITDRLLELSEIEDPDAFENAVKALRDDLPKMLIEIGADPETEKVVFAAMESASAGARQKSEMGKVKSEMEEADGSRGGAESAEEAK